MEQSKKKFLPVLQGVKLSKDSKPNHGRKIERGWEVIPYVLVIGSIKYAMLCTRPIVYLSIILTREYISDLRVDTWTAVKIILRVLRKYFSVMEMIKEFVVKSYIDARFYTDPDDSKSQSGYIFKVGAIS